MPSFMQATPLFLALTLVPFGTLAASLNVKNNWKVPCTSGSCSYYAGDGDNTAYHALKLSGPTSALSDLTTAGGWEIEGCSADWSSGPTNVTIECTGTNAQKANCEAVFEGGLKDTIVRLPNGCGTGPFARIVSSKDVTRFTSSGRRGPERHAVVLDYDFGAITANRGNVSFSLTSSNVESAGSDTPNPDTTVSSRDLNKRWSWTHMYNLNPINVDTSFTLMKASVSCTGEDGTGFTASMDVDVDADIDAKVAFGFTVSGTLIPLAVKTFEVVGVMNGTAEGYFTVTAEATGSISTGSIPIYEVSLGGLDIPGIISIGPTMGIYGQLQAEIAVETFIQTGFNWTYPSVEMIFPQSSGDSTANGIDQLSAPLTLSVDPTVNATAELTASLIPKVSFGVDLLSGFASANVYLELVASATLAVEVEVSGAINISNGTETASGDVSACASLSGTVEIVAGATGKIKHILDAEYSHDFFTKSVDLFDSCATKNLKRSVNTIRQSRQRHDALQVYDHLQLPDGLQRRDFTCSTSGLANLQELINVDIAS